MERGKLLNRELFFDQLNYEVKRARRYQNFFSLLRLKLSRIPGYDNGNGAGLKNCYQTLSNLLIEELRESDILGCIESDQMVILVPYADLSALGLFRSRLEDSLKYYEFRKKGYEIQIDPLCFPVDGTDATDFVEKLQEEMKTSLA
jgi:GGDEF domain-containing protein